MTDMIPVQVARYGGTSQVTGQMPSATNLRSNAARSLRDAFRIGEPSTLIYVAGIGPQIVPLKRVTFP